MNQKIKKDMWVECTQCHCHFLFPLLPTGVKTKQELDLYLLDFIYFLSIDPNNKEDMDMIDLVDTPDFQNQIAYEILGFQEPPNICPCCIEKKKTNKNKTKSLH